MFLADKAQLFAVAVICKRLDHVRTRAPEFPMQTRDDFGMLQYDFRHEGPRLQIPSTLEFKQISLGADDGVFVEALHQVPGVF